MCEACSPPRVPKYAGSTLILEKVACYCKCKETVLGPMGPHCEDCDHLVKIELTDGWIEPDLWINPKTKHPVRLDQVKA